MIESWGRTKGRKTLPERLGLVKFLVNLCEIGIDPHQRSAILRHLAGGMSVFMKPMSGLFGIYLYRWLEHAFLGRFARW